MPDLPLRPAPPEPELDLGLGRSAPGTPFTRGDTGLSRARFERLVRSGAVERVMRGVYVPTGTPLDPSTRAAAVRLVTPPGTVVVRRTAAWVHGAGTFPGEPVVRLQHAEVPPRHVVEVDGLRLTTPTRTALDLARHEPAAVALAATDGLLRCGATTVVELLAAADASYDGRVRELVALADGRAGGAVESVLRLSWLRSRLPTPVPGLVVPGRSDAVRLALALPMRRFGVVLRSAADDARLLDEVRARGWWVAVLDDVRVLGGDPDRLGRHLEQEFHQALLADVG